MPNTITTYNTFSGGTKARATQVNQNFSNYRGTLLPINEDSASASTNTHDLGSSDHRWNDFYANTINLRGATSTSAFKVVPSTSSTAGSVAFMFGATTAATFDPNGFRNNGQTSSSAISFSGATSTGTTLSSSIISINSHGRPIMISFCGATYTGGWSCSKNATASSIGTRVFLYRDGVPIDNFFLSTNPGVGSTNDGLVVWMQGPITRIDTPAAGAHTYYLTVETSSGSQTTIDGMTLVLAEF